MKAILIDPFLRTVTDVEVLDINGNMDLTAMKEVIDCDLIDIVNYGDFEMVLDDEGLFSKGEHQAYFNIAYEGRLHFYSGKALIVSSDREGNTCLLYTSPSPRD